MDLEDLEDLEVFTFVLFSYMMYYLAALPFLDLACIRAQKLHQNRTLQFGACLKISREAPMEGLVERLDGFWRFP